MKLSISLLDEEHPHLVAVRFTEQGASKWIAGEEIVDCNLDPLPVFAKLDTIDSLLVFCFREEQIFDKLGSLGKAGESAHEPTVA